MSSPIPPDCTCGHQMVDHVSSRARGLHPVRYGLCLIQQCPCERYEPAQPELPGMGPRRPSGRHFGARASQTAYRDRDHYDLARDLEAEKEPDDRER